MTQLLVKSIADFSTTLTSKTAVGATTATLTSGLDSDGVQLPTGVYGFTIDRNNTQKEHFTATLTVDVLTNIKTVTRGTGVGTAGFIRTHRKGAEIVITDHVALKRMMNVLDGTTSFDSATPLGYDGAPTISTGNQFATKTYVDGVAIAGGADSSTSTKGIGRVSVAPVSAATPIFIGDNDPRIAPNNHVTSTGSANAYVVTLTNAPASLVKGQMYSFLSNFANTTTATVNINSLGAKTIKKLGGATDLVSGDIAAGMVVLVEYDGTNFIMLNPVANAPLTPTGDGSGLTNLPVSIYYATASDNLHISADTERSKATSGLTLVKSVRPSFGGVIRVKHEMKGSSGASSVESRIYVNGTATGTSRTYTGTTYQAYSEDITINPGDQVQLYYAGDTGFSISCFVKNFRVYFDKTTAGDGTVITD